MAISLGNYVHVIWFYDMKICYCCAHFDVAIFRAWFTPGNTSNTYIYISTLQCWTMLYSRCPQATENKSVQLVEFESIRSHIIKLIYQHTHIVYLPQIIVSSSFTYYDFYYLFLFLLLFLCSYTISYALNTY